MTRGSGTSRPWPMPDAIALTAYARQIEAARAVGLSMTRTQAQAFLRILEAYAEELSARVAAGIATRTQEQSLAMAREIIRQMVRDLAVATGHGVRVTSDRVADIYAQATGDLLRSDPAGAAFTGTLFPALNTSAAQAVLSRPELSAAFVTIRRESVIAVDKIIQRAILRGATSTRTAMELRLHVLGADALPADLLLDRRRIGYDAIQAMGYEPTRENLLLVRKNAGQVAAKAQLIARTESMNAEWEAHMQAAAASPVVAAIRWKLSHRHKDVDACFRAGTLVATPWGEAPIESLAVGDVVLTHSGQGRPITRLYRNPAQRLLRLRYLVGNSHTREVVTTPNHPVLTERGWVSAGDLQTGDRGCGLPISRDGRSGLRPGGIEHTATRGSGGSGKAQVGGRTAGLLRDERRSPRARSQHRPAEGSRLPSGEYTSGVEFAPPLARRDSSGSHHLAETETAQPWSLPASPSHRSTASLRNWDCWRPSWTGTLPPRSTAASRSAACRCSQAERTSSRTGRTSAPERRLRGLSGNRPLSRIAALLPWTGKFESCGHRLGIPGLPSCVEPRLRTPWSSSASLLPGGPLAPPTLSAPWSFRSTRNACRPSPRSGSLEYRVSATIYPEAEIVAIEDVTPEAGEVVFNLEVDGDHTYLANGLVVHNCDLFAIADWYGLGAGTYDPRMVPPRPHPRCLCVAEDVIAPVSQWGQARGTPPVRRLEVADLVSVYELSPSQEAMVARALAVGEGRMLQQAAA